MTDRYIVNSEQRLADAIGELRRRFKEKKHFRMTLDDNRTLGQNQISHVWYDQIARELGEFTAEEVKCECKLRFGVPILRAEDATFRQMYDAGMKKLPYEQKALAMLYLPVTSNMNFDQFQRYLQALQHEYAPRGVLLEFPEKNHGKRAQRREKSE